MSSIPKIQDIKNRKILLDSNIPIHYAHKGFQERSGNPLRVLLDNGNKLTISPISALEILSGDNSEDIREKYLKFLNYVHPIEVTRGHYQNAAVLASEYRRICKGKKVPLPDLLIGGIIISYSFIEDKLLLFTTDREDFCEPLWMTVAHQAVPAEDKKNMQEHLYLLEFNVDILSPELV